MALCVLSGALVPGLKIGWAFGEGDPVTYLSCLSLLIVGWLSHQIWLARQAQGPPSEAAFVWRFFSFGFVYLACDDLLRIHETLDRVLHRIAGLRPTDLTDHLDDAIIGGYGAVGLIALVRYRKELRRFLAAWPYLSLAAACTALTVALDFLASAKWLLKRSIADAADLQLAIDILDVIEEWFKVYAEVFFIGAFLAALVQARMFPRFSPAGAALTDAAKSAAAPGG